jgi:hypothetical protein
MTVKDTIMIDLTKRAGFGAATADKTCAKRRRLGVELFATLALAVSLIVAATAVSIGVARAQAGYTMRPASGTPASAFLRTMLAGKIH